MPPKIKLFEDSETLKIGLEKTRKQILDLLKVKNMTISQISEALDKDQSTVYRHVKKLKEANFVEVKGEKKEHHVPERIYGRTADVFLMSPEPISSQNTSAVGVKWSENKVDELMKALESMDYDIIDEELIKDLSDHLQEIDKEINEELSESLEGNIDMDFFSIMQIKFILTFIKLLKEKEDLNRFKNIVNRRSEDE